MDYWLKSGSLKKTVKSFFIVPSVAVKASTANSAEEDGAVASAKISGQDGEFLDESVTADVPELPEVLNQLPTSSETRNTGERTVKRKYHDFDLDNEFIETSEN
uniref:Uncharacterized protein n=1 Tax=Sphaerodactylus townsendi TaxID=933632 RepID=A0ACB8FHK1_9SAUR